MLQALKKTRRYEKLETVPNTEVIVQKKQVTTEEDKNGNTITKTSYKEVNITKLVNETKKIIKQNSAEEKLKELEKVFSK